MRAKISFQLLLVLVAAVVLAALAVAGVWMFRTITGGARGVPPQAVRVTHATLRSSSQLEVRAHFDGCLRPAGNRVEWRGDIAYVTILAERIRSQAPCGRSGEQVITIHLSRRPSQVVDATCVVPGVTEADCRVIG